MHSQFLRKMALRASISAVLKWLAGLLLLPILIVAARATDGWPHLVLGLVIFSATLAIPQTAGVLIATRKEVDPVIALFGVKFMVVALLALWGLLGLAGIQPHDRDAILYGGIAGMVGQYALWSIWISVGSRYPQMKFQPGKLRGLAWYFRLRTNLLAVLGAAVAIGLSHR